MDRKNRLNHIKRRTPSNNAISLGNRLYFPVILKNEFSDISNLRLTDVGWLIHAWQFQHIGIRYLFDAIRVQIAFGSEAYDYDSKKGLENALLADKGFLDFNPEQQGDITREYYFRFKKGEDISDWEPFIQEIQNISN